MNGLATAFAALGDIIDQQGDEIRRLRAQLEQERREREQVTPLGRVAE